MVLGLTDLLQQGRKELITIGIDIHLIILKGQGKILIDEEVDERFLFLRQTEVLLFDKLQHRTFRQLIHAPLADITLFSGVDAEEEIEPHTHHWHEVDHQRPGHRLSRLTVVEHHMDDCQNGYHLPDSEYYDVPTHPITSLPNCLARASRICCVSLNSSSNCFICSLSLPTVFNCF